MSTVRRLPPEVSDFMDLPGHHTLLIRGPPGSGKSTFSLALLEEFRGDKVLITNRVGQDELGREFPWLGHNGGRSIQIVDTASWVGTVSQTAQTVAHSLNRLLETESATNADLSSFLWLPAPLQDAWSRMDPEHRTLVVIDSWDALVEQYLAGGPSADGAPDRAEIERLLMRRMSKLPSHLVFILEREEQTSLDYLVNGVIVAQREAREERLERWLTVLKLRGVRIENPVYPYTLESAKFDAVMPARPYALLRPGPPDPESDSMPGHLWPGSKDFASAFGRLPFGKLSLLELDDVTPIQAGDLLTYPMISHAVLRGGHVFFVPHSSTGPEEVVDRLSAHVPMTKLNPHLRLMAPRGWGAAKSGDSAGMVIQTRKLEFASAMGDPGASEPVQFLREGASAAHPGLLVVSVQGLESVANGLGVALTPDTVARLPDALLNVIHGQPVHAIAVCRTSSQFLSPLRAVATLRIEMNIRQGRIFVHGVSPWTPNHVLAEGTESVAYSLIRIV